MNIGAAKLPTMQPSNLERKRKTSIVHLANEVRACPEFLTTYSHPNGPNVIIHLNFYHAQQLAGILSEFKAAQEQFLQNGGHELHVSMYELYRNLEYTIDNYLESVREKEKE